jgi:hypothetical protein
MRPHIHPPPAEPHSLSLQPESLLHRRVTRQFDLTAGPQHALPRQSKPAPQYGSHLPRCPRISRQPRHTSIGGHFPARNPANRLLNPQTHRTSFVRTLPGDCHPERNRPARKASRPEKSKDPYPQIGYWVPRPCRVSWDTACPEHSRRGGDSSYATLRNASSASYSELCTSNTVSSFVTCSKSPTRLVKFASLMVPPALCAVV